MPEPEPPESARTLAQPYAQFGFDLLRELAPGHPGANLFISPASIAVALAMASNGATGPTRDAILKTLHAKSESLESFNAANQALVEEIGKTTAAQISMANALWLQQGFAVEPSFRQILRSAYSAPAESLDFRDPAAVHTINAWVAQHTSGRIQKLLSQLDPSTVAVLTNAVAFKGRWSVPFDPKDTGPHDFTTAAGNIEKVPMMKHTARYDHGDTGGLEAIRLPYADGTFAMYVVLPTNKDRMQSFLEQLTPDAFTALTRSLQSSRGTIELPCFTITYSAVLNPALARLGMGVAFGDRAAFTGITTARPLQISEVRHASFLKVDEEGTEAAAATSVGIRALAMRVEPPPFHMIVDRPFFVAIRDERSGQILFAGIIANPKG